MASDGLESMNEYQLKMLAKKEMGRDVLVWKKAELIRIIRSHRGVPNPTPKKERKTSARGGKSPPPAPRHRKLSVMNDDLMTHSAKELRDIAKDHGLEVTTWNKKKLIQMIEDARRSGKRPMAPSHVSRSAPSPQRKARETPPPRKPPQKAKKPLSPRPAPPPPTRATSEPKGDSAEVIALRKKLAEKEREIISLRKSISQQNKRAPPVRRPTSPQSDELKKALQDKDRQLEALTQRQSDTDAKMSSVSSQLTAMKKQLADTEKRLESRETDIERKVKRLEEEREFLADELNNAHTDMERTKAELEGLRQTSKGESNELKEMREMLNKMRTDKNGLEKQVAELTKNLEEWMSEFQSIEREKVSLTRQVSQLEDNNNDLVRQLSDRELEEALAEPAKPTKPMQPAPANLSSLTKEGEASESFQEIAYRDEFEATNMYDDIQVYGEEESDSNGLDSKRSDPDLSSLSRGPVRTDSVSTEDTELMTYGNDPHSGMSYSTKDPLMTQFDDEEPSEMDVMTKLLDGFHMYYPSEHWWYQDDNMEVVGPVSFEEMRVVSDLCIETFIWNGSNVPDWTRIQDLEGLQHLLPG